MGATSQPNNDSNYDLHAHCAKHSVKHLVCFNSANPLTHTYSPPLDYCDYYDHLLATDETDSGLLLIIHQVNGEPEFQPKQFDSNPLLH